MNVEISVNSGELKVKIKGEIDHHTSVMIRSQIDDALIKAKPSCLSIDFADVTFMDSSGVGLVMGRYKTAHAYGCEVSVVNLTDKYLKIMKMSGLEKIVRLERIEK